MATGHAYFTVERASGGFRSHFYGGDDKLVWWTEVYARKESAHAAIAFAKRYAANAPTYDRS
jgi:uncharacterized protein YegP (UPF0339 family)